MEMMEAGMMLGRMSDARKTLQKSFREVANRTFSHCVISKQETNFFVFMVILRYQMDGLHSD